MCRIVLNRWTHALQRQRRQRRQDIIFDWPQLKYIPLNWPITHKAQDLSTLPAQLNLNWWSSQPLSLCSCVLLRHKHRCVCRFLKPTNWPTITVTNAFYWLCLKNTNEKVVILFVCILSLFPPFFWLTSMFCFCFLSSCKHKWWHTQNSERKAATVSYFCTCVCMSVCVCSTSCRIMSFVSESPHITYWNTHEMPHAMCECI